MERWLVVPAPFDAAFILPVFFASATSSLIDLAGTLGCTTSTSGVEEIQLTGARSFSGSNLMRLEYSVTFTESDAVVKRMVCPSGGDCTASSAPMRPPAPARLSTRNVCFRLSLKNFPSNRAWMSVPPPAPKGTMMRTGLLGQVWAIARPADPAAKVAITNAALKLDFMRLPPRFLSTTTPVLDGCCNAASQCFDTNRGRWVQAG